MTQLGIHLLGNFHVTDDGQTIKGLDQARMQALLAYLLLNQDAPVSRQQLAYTFWPESDEKQALNNLRTLFYRLRQTLPDAETFLSYDRHTLQWRPDADYILDVDKFESALARAQTAEQDGDRQAMRAELEHAANVLLLELQREREEKSKLLSRL
jgi:DNA-binding SARP family transcriptional activator